MSYTASYTEGDRAVTIVPNLYVVDTDPDPVIIRWVLYLRSWYTE